MTTPRSGKTSIVIGRRAAFGATAFTRAAVLVGLHGHMDRLMWLRLAGEFWTTTDGDKRELVSLMRTYDDWQPMMCRHEAQTWRNLPEWFRAWRGCYKGFNEDGLSYALDNEAARDYPYVARYRVAGVTPVLRCVWINRADCIIKMDRGGIEVLARVVNEWDRKVLDWSVSPNPFLGTSHLRALAAS